MNTIETTVAELINDHAETTGPAKLIIDPQIKSPLTPLKPEEWQQLPTVPLQPSSSEAGEGETVRQHEDVSPVRQNKPVDILEYCILVPVDRSDTEAIVQYLEGHDFKYELSRLKNQCCQIHVKCSSKRWNDIDSEIKERLLRPTPVPVPNHIRRKLENRNHGLSLAMKHRSRKRRRQHARKTKSQLHAVPNPTGPRRPPSRPGRNGTRLRRAPVNPGHFQSTLRKAG